MRHHQKTSIFNQLVPALAISSFPITPTFCCLFLLQKKLNLLQIPRRQFGLATLHSRICFKIEVSHGKAQSVLHQLAQLKLKFQ